MRDPDEVSRRTGQSRRASTAWRSDPRRRPVAALAAVLASGVAVLASGCLGHVYEVPRTELERLVRTPPEERGQAVYAVQQFDLDPEPAPAPAWAEPTGEPPPGYAYGPSGYWIPSLYSDFGPPSCPPRGGHTSTVVAGGGSSRSGAHAASGGGVSSGGANIKDCGQSLLVGVAIGVGIGVVLAVSEGSRHEGTVAVHPHHPLHLQSGGEQRVVALDELSADDVRSDVQAVLVDREGAGMWLRERAPLNRQGFSFQFGAGNDLLALPGQRVEDGLGWRFGLGYFPVKAFGVLGEARAHVGDNGNGSFYDARAGLEAQWYPLVLWRLHLGGFGGAGQSWYASAGSALLPATTGSRPYVDFGALAELDLTTRLGLTFRWTEDWLPTASPDTRRLGNSWSVGLAVY